VDIIFGLKSFREAIAERSILVSVMPPTCLDFNQGIHIEFYIGEAVSCTFCEAVPLSNVGFANRYFVDVGNYIAGDKEQNSSKNALKDVCKGTIRFHKINFKG
jgi:hypothetical protein